MATELLPKMILRERIERFFDLYANNLADVAAQYPTEYQWEPGVTAGVVAGRMRASVERSGHFGSINKDSRAIRATCRALGIKHTYSAMNEYLAGA